MNFIKCEMHGCGNYIDDSEAKIIVINNIRKYICESCDHDEYKEIYKGDRNGSKPKIEKVKKKNRFHE